MPMRMLLCLLLEFSPGPAADQKLVIETLRKAQSHNMQLHSSNSPAKIFQTEQGAGYAMKFEQEYFFILLDQPGPLRAIENNKAPTVKDAALQQVGTTRYADNMPHHSRIAVADQHPSNPAAEHEISEDRKTWPSNLIACEAHIWMLIFKGYQRTQKR